MIKKMSENTNSTDIPDILPEQEILVSQMVTEMGYEVHEITNQIKVEEVASFPPNSNPFHHDLYHMGTQLHGPWMAMYSGSNGDELSYMYLVHTTSGRRFRLDLTTFNAGIEGNNNTPL